MKNPKRKPVFVILLKDGKPEGEPREVCDAGKIGFHVKGVASVLWNEDKGKTWEPAESEAKA